MSVLIVKKSKKVKYDLKKPIEPQVRGCTHVIVNYKPGDQVAEHFLDEVERICQKSQLWFDIKMVNQFSVNDIIKKVTLIQESADKSLQELSTMCLNNECKKK